MAKTSIYLPDDLAEQVRAHGIPVSEVAQTALRQAVREAEIKENVMTDIQAVADRLNAAEAAKAEADRAQVARESALARAYGAEWARTTADMAELECLATYDDRTYGYTTPLSLITFVSQENERRHRAAGGLGLPGSSSIPLRPADRYWPDLQAGIREVWEAVRPLLADRDEHSGGRLEYQAARIVDITVRSEPGQTA
jgi:post-segregation antitoxin (ccd killing protein)